MADMPMWFPVPRAGQTPTAKERFDELEPSDEEPLERLRIFLSLALKGQDWLDVEPFLAAITAPAAKCLTDERIETLAAEHESFGFGAVGGKSAHGFSADGLRAFTSAVLAAAAEAQSDSREQRLAAAMKRFDEQGSLPGMIAAFEQQFGQSWTDREWRQEASIWSAAWRAALATRTTGKPEADS